MNKEYSTFITGLLADPKLTSAQRNKVIELALRDLGKNGLEERILKDLELIKENLGIKVELPKPTFTTTRDETRTMTEEDLAGNGIIPGEKKVKIKKNLSPEDIEGNLINEKKPQQSSPVSKTKYVDIKNTPKFLRSLNSNTYTKFLTHEIDSDDIEELKILLGEEYSYIGHLQKIKEVFDVLTNSRSKYKQNHPGISQINISQNLYSKIKSYIYGENLWGENKNEINWSLPDLIEWSKNNPQKVPSPGKDLNYNGFKYKKTPFKNIVLAFKHEINIRSSNSFTAVFNTIIYNPKYDYRNKIVFDLNIDDSIELFTDVEKLKQAIRLILNFMIDKNPLDKKPEVRVIFYELKEKIYLKIKSCGSFIDSNKNTFRYGKSTKNLMKLCNGICEVELIALFKDQKIYKGPIWQHGFVLENDNLQYFNKRINIINLYKEIKDKNKSTSTFGVEYILTMDLGL